ncbi:MAG: 30S ribosomal protein S9 [Patescibacteria group bacterium]|jgi:small subunit ribosomal protein S9
MPKKTANNYTFAVGRRKAASATVKLFFGKGDSHVNELSADKYFPGNEDQSIYNHPFLATDTLGKYYFTARISGGGKKGQLEALQLAIARALQKSNQAVFTSLLRGQGLLTVDSRVKERRMVGTGGKARRQKQSPKR